MDHLRVQNSSSFRLFEKRNSIYKIGFLLVVVSFLLYLFSIFLMDWILIPDSDRVTGMLYVGIWTGCDEECEKENLEKSEFHIIIFI